ncbi:MAG: hypothetical protein QHH19_00480 [Candidatus Thermoplasmatota archaeon]|nr:hypothetical protein [Candidatus Thermoplasmatota archaeon]
MDNLLVNKNKTKNRIEKDSYSSEENIQSFRNWIRKIEQTTNSISSRLSAVEKRISRKTDDSDKKILYGTLEEPISRVFTVLKDEENKKTIEEAAQVLDSEFSIMQEEIKSLQDDVDGLREKTDELKSLLNKINENIKVKQIYTSKVLYDISLRLEKIERREPPFMKLGDMEIPIEITGFIGGILVFIIAVMVALGHKEIVISPLFLFLIGIVLIASTLLKTFNIKASNSKPFRKPKPSKINDSS